MPTESDNYLIKLGKRIAEIRIKKDITQYRMAKDLLMEQSNLARIEDGNTNPTINTLKKIADVLGVKVKDLIEF